jgi:hypothetical protein
MTLEQLTRLSDNIHALDTWLRLFMTKIPLSDVTKREIEREEHRLQRRKRPTPKARGDQSKQPSPR